jgi:O-acetyl-ADP-ribose deacetylase (regulator of RNase III)
MIIHKDGNLLKAEENIIGHQVNCQGVMQSGIAIQIADRYIKVATDHTEICNYYRTRKYSGLEGLLGKVQLVSIDKDKYICNIFSQLDYNRDYSKGREKHTSYKALAEALHELKRIAKESNLSVALPYNLGSDRGGAKWEVVEALIDEAFEDYQVTIYKFKK